MNAFILSMGKSLTHVMLAKSNKNIKTSGYEEVKLFHQLNSKTGKILIL